MKYSEIKKLSDEQFRRLTGVKLSVFNLMVEILSKAEKIKKAKGGRSSKLSIEDRLLMTLEYLREYRTYFHTAQSYGVSESTAFKIVRWVEDVLIKDSNFALPGKKALLKNDSVYETVLIDVTESSIERPKKSKDNITQEKRKDTH
jgi:Helix-turn-helix of DDE superfamily endonuclease